MTRPAFAPVKRRQPGTPKAAIAALFTEAGGVPRVQVKLGLGASQVYAYSDPQAADEISFARVAALTDSTASAAAEYLAALAGGAFLPGAPPAAGDAQGLTAAAVREHGEAMALLVEYLRDGKLGAGEARRTLPDIDQAVQALMALRAELLARIREDGR